MIVCYYSNRLIELPHGMILERQSQGLSTENTRFAMGDRKMKCKNSLKAL